MINIKNINNDPKYLEADSFPLQDFPLPLSWNQSWSQNPFQLLCSTFLIGDFEIQNYGFQDMSHFGFADPYKP